MRNAFMLCSAMGLFSLGALSLPGCGDNGTSGSGGSGGTGGTGGSTGVSVDAACKDFAAAVCGRLETCVPFLLDTGYGDTATCEARVTPKCVATPDLAGSKFDAAAIQACADAYGNVACGDLLSGITPDACKPAGDKADGATCAAAVECKGGICQNPGEGQCGACATPLPVGSTCDVGNDICGPGLYCGASSSKCEKYGQKGDACDQAKLCGGGLSCNAGTCGDMLPEGADCSGGAACDSLNGLVCNANSHKCVKIGIAKLGEACGFDAASGDIVLCEAGAECDFMANKCIARLKEGDSCTIDPQTKSSHCDTGFQCISGKCSSGYPSCQ